MGPTPNTLASNPAYIVVVPCADVCPVMPSCAKVLMFVDCAWACCVSSTVAAAVWASATRLSANMST